MAEAAYSLAGKKVWVAGHRGMVGSALVDRLVRENCETLTVGREALDLTRQAETEAWMAQAKPDAVFIAAAKVGGILANDTFPVEFLYDNLMIEANIIRAAHKIGVEKLLVLGSVCVYPKFAPIPVEEGALLTGALEPTNEWYAIAKIAAIKLAQAYRRQHSCDFISAMPANLYGPNDNFDLDSSHVLPAILRKAHEAKRRNDKQIVVWGTGSPLREFLHVSDCADALVFLMKSYSGAEQVNVGSGSDISILDLTKLICEVVGFEGEIVQDRAKPDGTPRRLMNAERLAGLGWKASIDLRAGIADAYRWFLQNEAA